MSSTKLKVAVVGGGAAGIGAAHKLSQLGHDVTIIESGNRIGGHANPVVIESNEGPATVDTGFLIFNDSTYPNFCQFLKELEVIEDAHNLEMSSCFRNTDDQIEYSMGQKDRLVRFGLKEAFNPRFWSIFKEMYRFRKKAHSDIVNKVDLSSISIEEYLKDFSKSFSDNFVYPLTSAIWSLPPSQIGLYPAQSILNYFYNHQLLAGKSDKRWLSFKGSSAVYLDAFRSKFSGKIILNSLVKRIERDSKEISIFLDNEGAPIQFDKVILATPADMSLKLLSDPSPLERDLLARWRYNSSTATLHTDTSVLHKDKKLWSSWNMNKSGNRYFISYYLNRVHDLKSNSEYVLSLGTPGIRNEKIIQEFQYRHPIFDQESVSSQVQLQNLNRGQTAFCGSYFGFGFHEDAFASGLKAAQSIL